MQKFNYGISSGRILLKRLLRGRAGIFIFARHMEVIVNAVFRRKHDPEFATICFSGKNPFILDVGSNLGQSSITLNALFPESHIVAFEPNPSCTKTFLKVLKILGFLSKGTIEFVQAGLANSQGSMPFYIPVLENGVEVLQEGTFDRSMLDLESTRVRIDGVHEIKRIKVPVYRLDDLGYQPDIMKIDVQGLELDVLKGAEKTIRKHMPLIFLERDPRHDKDVEAWLIAKGYIKKDLVTNTLYTPKDWQEA